MKQNLNKISRLAYDGEYQKAIEALIKIIEKQEETIKFHDEVLKNHKQNIYSLKTRIQNNSSGEEQ